MKKNSINSPDLRFFFNSGGTLSSEIFENNLSIEYADGHTSILIKNCFFNKPIAFKACKFSGSITFEGCKFGEISFSETLFASALSFVDCTVNERLVFDSVTLSKLNIDNGSIADLAFFGNLLTAKYYEIIIQNGKFNKIYFNCKDVNHRLTFKSIDAYELIFKNCSLNEALTFEGESLTFNDIVISGCNFLERIDFKQGKIEEWLDIRKSTFNDTVLFQEIFVSNSINFHSVTANHILGIYYNGNIGSLRFSDCKFVGDFSCTSKMYNEESKKPGDLSVYFDGTLSGQVKIDYIDISVLSFSGINNADIIVDNVGAQFLYLDNFFNNSRLIISNLRVIPKYSTFIISQANIGKTELLNVDLRKFTEVVVVNSNVSEWELSNSVLPNAILIRSINPKMGFGPPIASPINDNTFYRETYRQLKQAAEKQGNRHLALRFKSKEFYYLRKELTLSWDNTLLFLNYISNNHGISWSRGILFTLVMAYVFFLIYNQSTESYFYWTLNTSIVETWQAFLTGANKFVDFLLSYPK